MMAPADVTERNPGDGLWDRLVSVLGELAAVCRLLLELGQAKRKALIVNAAPEIERLTSQEQALLAKARQLDKARTALVRDLASAYGLRPGKVRLRDLRELAVPGVSSRLAEISGEVGRVATELAAVNRLNAKLTHQVLSFVDYNINLLAQNATSVTYAPPGQSAKPPPGRVLFDEKA